MGHADGKRDRTAGTVHQAFLNFLLQAGQFLNLHAKGIEGLLRRVDGKVVCGNEHAGGNQRHNGHETFEQHGTVAYKEHIVFPANHLGRGSGADGGMEAGERAAGDGNKDEGNDRAADNGAAAFNKLSERRHVEVRHDKDDADGQRQNGAHFQEGGEIVSRQQQPDGENGGDEAVNRNQNGHGFLVDIQPAEDFGMGGDHRAGEQAQKKQNHADDGCAQHVALTPDLHVQAHDNGDGNRCRHGVSGPEAVVHGVDNCDGQTVQFWIRTLI